MRVRSEARHFRPRPVLSLGACALGALLIAPAEGARQSGDASVGFASEKWDAGYFMPGSRYDPAVPTPESVLGFPIGRRPVRYDEMRHYFEALDAASSRVLVRPYAVSHEGRELVYVAVGTEARVGDLEAVRKEVERFADPSHTQTDGVSANLPVVAWLGYAIHGDELSSTDAALQVAYQLAAGQDSITQRIRERVLVLIDPSQNPDGRERFLSQIQSMTGSVPNPDDQSLQHQGFWPWGRANHYLFDLNRDWFNLVNPESQGRVTAMSAWNPQLVVDSHEMGWDETYLFSPPREPFNPHLPTVLRGWWQIFAGDQAAAFDRRGWSYYTREWNEEFFPGYGSSWGMYRGAVGMLYEQAGTDGSVVRQPDGSYLNYRDAVAHQFTSSVTNLDTAARHRAELLHDFAAGRRQAADAAKAGPVRAFAYAAGADPDRAWRLTQTLQAQGIQVFASKGTLSLVDAHDTWGGSFARRDLPAGSFVVPLDQPLAPLVQNLLGFHIAMPDSFLREERSYLERGKGSRLYEVTAWSMPIAYGLESYWCAGAPRGDLVPPEAPPVRTSSFEKPPAYGYIIDGASEASMHAVARLLEAGMSVRVALEPFQVHGSRFGRGSVLLRAAANPESLRVFLNRVAAETGATVYGTDTGHAETGPDLGGGLFPVLERPRVALVSNQPVSFTSYGALWHLLDHDLRLRVSSLDVQRLAGLELGKYNVIVLPAASGGASGYAAALGKGGVDKLRNWVESGGTLIGIADGAAFAADTTQSLSAARLREQVLKEFASPRAREPLPETGLMQALGDKPLSSPPAGPTYPLLGPGALQYVRQIHPRGVRWVYEPVHATVVAAPKEKAAKEDKAGKGGGESHKGSEQKDLERADSRLQRFAPHGAFLRVDLDGDHWLTGGMPARAAIFLDSDLALIARSPVRVVGRYAETDSLQVSGLLWPEAADRLTRTAYLTQERRGKGQVILFADEPTFRRSLPGVERLLLNAVLLGPGLGTSHAAPW